MKRFFRGALGAALLLLPWLARAGGPYGTDNGWAVDHNSGAVLLTSTMAKQMSAGETGWIRVEMFLVSGHSTWDPTVLSYYDSAVNNARNAGLQVLLLIDGGSWPGGQTAWTNQNAETISGANGDNVFVGAFATNAVWPIVQHFRDRVKVYEIWNEPNAWTTNSGNLYWGGTFMYPSNYGWLLARSWEAVHITHQINDVTLFFGGVFGHNIKGITSYANAGAQYIDDTYSTGTNVHKGQSFNYIKTNYNAYPLDGIGEHLYLSQGGTVSSNTFRQYEDWVRQACTKYEGVNTPKKTFITEFGWTTASVSQAVQDTNLVTSFSAINATPYVQMAIWFQWADNPAGSMYFGVTNTSSGPKLAFPDYQRFQRFEGAYSNGATNSSIRNYYNGLSQAVLGNPFDNGSGPWVYALPGGFAQDYDGGSHQKLVVLSSTNGTFEINDLHGFRSFFLGNSGPTAFGLPLDNEFASGSGTRQDFGFGYLTWDATNQVVWHQINFPPPAPDGLSAAPGNAQVSLQWSAVPGASSYYVKRSITNGGPYSIVSSVSGSPAFIDTPLANGTTYFYVVTALGQYGESANSVQVNATPDSSIGGLPSPWQDADLGNVVLNGTAGFRNGVYTVKGSGAGIGSVADAFHFLFQPLSGNGGIIARVKTESNTDPGAQAGVMIRESLASDSAFGLVAVTPGRGLRFQSRSVAGGGTADLAGPAGAAPYWVKLSRMGNVFSASVSSNGIAYAPAGSATLAMSNDVWIGLAVSSRNTNALNAASFDNLVITPPPVAGLAAAPGNGAVSLAWSAASGATGYAVKRASVTGGPYSNIATIGATTGYLDTAVANGATYFYVVAGTNAAGEGGLSSEASAMPAAPPEITAQPQSLTVNQGGFADFSVTATSLVSMTFQWQFNGASIPGATGSDYAITNTQPPLAGAYTVLVSNYGGSITSAPAILRVRPLLTWGPRGVLSWTGNYTLQSAADVTGPYADVPGATSPWTNNFSAARQFFRLRQ